MQDSLSQVSLLNRARISDIEPFNTSMIQLPLCSRLCLPLASVYFAQEDAPTRRSACAAFPRRMLRPRGAPESKAQEHIPRMLQQSPAHSISLGQTRNDHGTRHDLNAAHEHMRI